MKDFLKKTFGGEPAPIGRRFEGRVALVTGATSGIGLSTALAFAGEGATVVMLGRRESEGAKVLERVRSASPESMFIATDVQSADDVKRAFDTVRNRFGRLDAAFNNAGVIHPGKPVGELEESDVDDVLETNVRGVWRCLHEEVSLMERAGGAIVNMSSISGVSASPGLGMYVASKHAVVGMTRSAALDYAEKNIRINAICPGFIRTDMTRGTDETWLRRRVPIRRWIEPEEIAGIVLFLCSDAAASITGQAIVADGGATLRAG